MTDMTMTARMTDRATARTVERYLDMADTCRKMAATVRRPAILLLRAEHYERAAADLAQRAVANHG
jgi:hypothetical protein